MKQSFVVLGCNRVNYQSYSKAGCIFKMLNPNLCPILREVSVHNAKYDLEL